MTKMQMHFVLPLWSWFVVVSLLLLWLPILMFCVVSCCVCFVFLFCCGVSWFPTSCCGFSSINLLTSTNALFCELLSTWCRLICLFRFAGGCLLDPKANTKTRKRMKRIYFGCSEAGGWWLVASDERRELQPSGKPRTASAEHMNRTEKEAPKNTTHISPPSRHCRCEFQLDAVFYFVHIISNLLLCYFSICFSEILTNAQRSDTAEYCDVTAGLTFDLLDIEIPLPHFVIGNICVKCCHY